MAVPVRAEDVREPIAPRALPSAEPPIAPDDVRDSGQTHRDARPPLEDVIDWLSKSDRAFLEFMKRAVRVEIGEDLQPVVLVPSPEVVFDPLAILMMVHQGLLATAADPQAVHLFLVKTDVLDRVLAPPPPPRRKRARKQSGIRARTKRGKAR